MLERLVPIEIERLDDRPFACKMEFASVGPLRMKRLTQGALRSEMMPNAARHRDGGGTVATIFLLAGALTCQQDGRESVQQPGDIVVLDRRHAVVTSSAGSQALFLKLPRERLEGILGPSRLYTSLTMGADLASTILVTNFFHDLIRVRRQLTPDAADRMALIGADLIVANIAERLARAVPRPLHGTVVVQRAKAYVEDHLADLTLDPPQLAAAVGVSLRRLQELFHERDQHISDWIWGRRLEVAAKRLCDPGFAHLSIGVLAYGSGFGSQPHFSKRFKDRFSVTPREYRQAALIGAP
ncbi:AraC-type DNA-binding protein [Methylobacterium pseudosasicola]|uniref:AraC-type DNA-binding protein n=2 Tax=Methylobacterium pseudosasicola TaxID=582667 RepID=A0A1I4FVY7_9HYPH|nr:AraC-type DNA-binding protein [Methylobacterium pseudosasicola]